jgi:hypothetical protein
MGNTSSINERSEKEKRERERIERLDICFLCNDKIKGNIIGYPNEQYYNLFQQYEDRENSSSYAVCGNCNNIDTNRYYVKIHKERMKKEQYIKLRISQFNIDAMNEWDIKNSYYQKSICVKIPETIYWREYKYDYIQSIEHDKIIINESWLEICDDYRKKCMNRWKFANTILGMDSFTYNMFDRISEYLREKIIIYLQEEGNTHDTKDRWEKEQVGNIITFRRVGISIL